MAQPVDLEQGIQQSLARLGKERKDLSLGILLVHGIGEQMRGDTLTEEGDYITRWLRRLVVGEDEGKDEDKREAEGEAEGEAGGKDKKKGRVDVLDVAARLRSTDTIPAAHALIRITPPVGDPALWVVAESWWAESFRPAKPIELAGWAVTVGPWVFATHVAGVLHRTEIAERVPWPLRLLLVPIAWLAGGVFVLGGAIVSLLVTLFAAAVMLLALVPIGFISDFARSIQRSQANGFGDAYVLTRSPVGFGAMATQVRSDLQTLLRKCPAVAVIAHSQGTAVAWYAIQHEVTEEPDVKSDALARLRLFLTYGQAVRKLTFALKMARGEQTGARVGLALAGAALVGLAVVGLMTGADLLLVFLATAAAVVAELALLRSARKVWDRAGEDLAEDWAVVKGKAKGLEWLDLWASADPAPVGPLGVSDVTSYKIRNYASPILDHVTYWWNTTEFLPIVAGRLFRLGGPQAYVTDPSDPRLLVAALRRHARVLALMTARVFVWGGVLAGFLYAWRSDFGREVTDWVGSLNLPLVDGFFDAPPDWAVLLAGFVAVLLLGVVAWLPVSLMWSALTAADEKTFFRGVQLPLWTFWWYVFGALVAVIAAAAATLLLLAGDPVVAVGYVFASILAASLGLAVLSGGGTTFAAAGERVERARAAANRIVPDHEWISAGVVLAVIAVIVAVPVAVWRLSPDQLGWALAAVAVVLSAVLAVEGLWEYALFRRRFKELNDLLPCSPPRTPSAS